MKIALVLALVLCCGGGHADSTVVVDPRLAYYKGRSARSIVEEIKVNGYDQVHLACPDESAIDGDLVTASADAGVKVWMTVTVNGVRSTAGLPEGWEQWRMRLRGPEDSGDFIYLCPNNPAYRQWKKLQVTTALSKYAFYGVDLSGSFFPGRGGPRSDDYGCLCNSCSAAFEKMYPGVGGPPDFDDPESTRYWKTDKLLYEKWVGFRVSSMVNFLDDLVNGKGGIREKCPLAKVATWSVGTGWAESLAEVREFCAMDAAATVKRVRPDKHVIRTDESDWKKPDLSATYPAKYAPIAGRIHEASPLVPLVLQTDIGSDSNVRRTRAWMEEVAKSADEAGFPGVLYDEYSLGDYIYTETPSVVTAAWVDNAIELVFSKRVDSVSASNIGNYTLTSGHVDYAKVDGNLVRLSISGVSPPADVVVSGVADDEASRLFHDRPACVMEAGASVAVPEPDD